MSVGCGSLLVAVASTFGQTVPPERSQSVCLLYNSIQGLSASYAVCFGAIEKEGPRFPPSIVSYRTAGWCLDASLGIGGARGGFGYSWVNRTAKLERLNIELSVIRTFSDPLDASPSETLPGVHCTYAREFFVFELGAYSDGPTGDVIWLFGIGVGL